MGTLAALLKKPATTTSSVEKKQTKTIFEKKNEETVVVSPTMEGLEFDITEDELAQVRASVVEVETEGKTRRQIIVGKYGEIKNPRTGKRFVIPGVDYSADDYGYQYAEMMRTLVNRPDDFKKIMNWE